MIKISTIAKLSAATLLSTCVSMANAGERVSDFSLVDAKGRFFQLSRHANPRLKALDSVPVKVAIVIAYDQRIRSTR